MPAARFPSESASALALSMAKSSAARFGTLTTEHSPVCQQSCCSFRGSSSLGFTDGIASCLASQAQLPFHSVQLLGHVIALVALATNIRMAVDVFMGSPFRLIAERNFRLSVLCLWRWFWVGFLPFDLRRFRPIGRRRRVKNIPHPFSIFPARFVLLDRALDLEG